MIKLTYISTILHQAYRRDKNEQVPCFQEEMIGVPVAHELYAVNEDTAYNLITKWNGCVNREYKVATEDGIDIIEHIQDSDMENGTRYYADVHSIQRWVK